MQHKITSVADLGVLVRAARKTSNVRIDDLAAMAGMSKQFLSDLELGKPSVHLGKALQVMEELGLYVYVDAPESVAAKLQGSSEHIRRTNERRNERTAPSAGRAPMPASPNHRAKGGTNNGAQ